MSERKDIDRREAELVKRKGDLDKLRSGLKTLIELGIETTGDARAKAHYDRICKITNAGGDPLAKINKTQSILELLRHNGVDGLDIEMIQKKLIASGIDVNRNYLHTVLSSLRKRELLTKEANVFLLTEKGRELPLKAQLP